MGVTKNLFPQKTNRKNLRIILSIKKISLPQRKKKVKNPTIKIKISSKWITTLSTNLNKE
ncbi:hypothetical protein AKJ63_01595 [candidate division MSBL1 archaeon SCGC-AAA259D18]|uniref:Uncharacterized protein n=1 Tax=candidate division MSBL1 archaeon SCGC-AAA259D18 TaxID=1698262 RepID=A0A133UAX4_9EURY|nr:hypothetical protein AKJ63_01595 [candidate division MSBL1 archaeon SCGC-AAA259D18]